MEKKQSIIVPMLTLRGMTVFPNMIVSLPAGREKSLAAVNAAEDNANHIFLLTQRDASVMEPGRRDLYSIGTLAVVKQILKLPGNLTHVVVEGKERGRLEDIRPKGSCDYAKITTIGQDFEGEPDTYMLALMRIAVEQYEEYMKRVPNTTSVDLLGNITTAKMPGLLADIVATGLDIPVHRKQYLLEILNPIERLEAVVAEMRQERAVLDIKKEIEGKTKQRIDQNQREYFLREEMKVLQEELGDKDGVGADAADFRKRLEEKNPPEQGRSGRHTESPGHIPRPVPDRNPIGRKRGCCRENRKGMSLSARFRQAPQPGYLPWVLRLFRRDIGSVRALFCTYRSSGDRFPHTAARFPGWELPAHRPDPLVHSCILPEAPL